MIERTSVTYPTPAATKAQPESFKINRVLRLKRDFFDRRRRRRGTSIDSDDSDIKTHLNATQGIFKKTCAIKTRRVNIARDRAREKHAGGYSKVLFVPPFYILIPHVAQYTSNVISQLVRNACCCR